MQTEDIVLWVDKAIEVREASFIPHVMNSPSFPGTYGKNNIEALKETKPPEAKNYDESIALWMIKYNNDVTDWKKQIEKDNKEIYEAWMNNGKTI